MDIKQKILSERGLVKVTKHKPDRQRNSFGKFSPSPRLVISGKSKTPLMKYVEEKYKVKIEEVLVSGSLSIVSKKLGNEVDVTTLSKWIKRFKLRYTAANLPSCDDCPHWEITCNGGVCALLMKLEEWDLMMVKREEVINKLKEASHVTTKE